jgi:hypothetical protein
VAVYCVSGPGDGARYDHFEIHFCLSLTFWYGKNNLPPRAQKL